LIDILPGVIATLCALWCGAVLVLRIGLSRLKTTPGECQPTVTVLVAARNEAKVIARLVRALIDQDYPREKLELILIDDGSTDGTAQMAREASAGASHFKVITAPTPPPDCSPKKNALLAGIAASSGEIILTTDADCLPPTGWVRGMAAGFSEDTSAVVGYSPLVGDDTWKKEHGTDAFPRFDSFLNGVIAAGAVGIRKPLTAVGRNFAYQRDVFDSAGGFGGSIQAASGDDDLLLHRIASIGGKVKFSLDPGTFVPSDPPRSLSDWLRMKRRHLSAGVYYDAGWVALFIALYLFHAGIVLLAVLTFSGAVSPFWLAGIWGVKMIADEATLAKGARLLHERGWGWIWLLEEIVTPFLVTLLLPLVLFGKVRWKGRELRS
jgi:cellulose synthase/poly-beta-1,6-N-acetylglucosamine synthase-like glycosyltransferase